jgi:hypothetical protein
MEQQWDDLTDEFGPHKIVLLLDRSVGLRGVVVVDNVAAGPAIGGGPPKCWSRTGIGRRRVGRSQLPPAGRCRLVLGVAPTRGPPHPAALRTVPG